MPDKPGQAREPTQSPRKGLADKPSLQGLEKQQLTIRFSWEQENVVLIPTSEISLIRAWGKAFSEPMLRSPLVHLQG